MLSLPRTDSGRHIEEESRTRKRNRCWSAAQDGSRLPPVRIFTWLSRSPRQPGEGYAASTSAAEMMRGSGSVNGFGMDVLPNFFRHARRVGPAAKAEADRDLALPLPAVGVGPAGAGRGLSGIDAPAPRVAAPELQTAPGRAVDG